MTWYLWGATGIVLVALLGSGLMATARLLMALHRTRARRYRPVHWDDLAGPIGRMTVVAVTASVLLWAGAGAAALHGT